MTEGQQPGCDHARLGRIEIIDLNAMWFSGLPFVNTSGSWAVLPEA
jgi:hypothetical protein